MKTIFISALVVVVLTGCAGYVPGRQAYWDAQVREMCQKDGGVKIIEKLHISKADVDLLGTVGGKIDVPLKQLAKPNSPAYAEIEITKLKEDSPVVTRTESTIIRRADNAVLARWVVYSRFGGDLPSPSHPSSFRCPEINQIASDLQPLFIVEKDWK